MESKDINKKGHQPYDLSYEPDDLPGIQNLPSRGFSHIVSEAAPMLTPAGGFEPYSARTGKCKKDYEGVVYERSGLDGVKWNDGGECPTCSCTCITDFTATPTGVKSDLDYGLEWQTELVSFSVYLAQETKKECVVTLSLSDGGKVRVIIPSNSSSGSKTVWVYTTTKTVSLG